MLKEGVLSGSVLSAAATGSIPPVALCCVSFPLSLPFFLSTLQLSCLRNKGTKSPKHIYWLKEKSVSKCHFDSDIVVLQSFSGLHVIFYRYKKTFVCDRSLQKSHKNIFNENEYNYAKSISPSNIKKSYCDRFISLNNQNEIFFQTRAVLLLIISISTHLSSHCSGAS